MFLDSLLAPSTPLCIPPLFDMTTPPASTLHLSCFVMQGVPVLLVVLSTLAAVIVVVSLVVMLVILLLACRYLDKKRTCNSKGKVLL